MDKKVNAMKTTDQRRRQFLLAVGMGGVGAVAALAGVSKAPAEKADAVAEAEPAAVKGYQASEHVRKYYRTTKV